MSALLITVGKVAADGQDVLERYAAGTIPLIEAAGGTVIRRLRPTETVVGENGGRPDLVAMIRFDSPEAVRALLQSAAYRRQVAHRNRAFAEIHSYTAMDI
jgi:uncharacterized protein (DUF1330 family)